MFKFPLLYSCYTIQTSIATLTRWRLVCVCWNIYTFSCFNTIKNWLQMFQLFFSQFRFFREVNLVHNYKESSCATRQQYIIVCPFSLPPSSLLCFLHFVVDCSTLQIRQWLILSALKALSRTAQTSASKLWQWPGYVQAVWYMKLY